MVQIGNPVKYDNYGRVTCPSELAELLQLEKGFDEVVWSIEGGNVIMRKVTKIYGNGFDFEKEEIEDRLKAYEQQRITSLEDDDLDPEEQEARAYEAYLKDQEARKARKKNIEKM